MKNSTWLLLLYGLPAKGNTARVSLWRKLKRYGAVQLKASAYILPDKPEHYERFQWLASEIQESGGEATLLRVGQIEGIGDEQIIRMFDDARAADYKEVSQACRVAISAGKRMDQMLCMRSVAGKLGVCSNPARSLLTRFRTFVT